MPLAASPASFISLAGYLMLAGGSFALVRPGLGMLLSHRIISLFGL